MKFYSLFVSHQVEEDGEREQEVVSETGLDIGVRTCNDVTGGCGDACCTLFGEAARPDGVNLTGSSLVMAWARAKTAAGGRLWLWLW